MQVRLEADDEHRGFSASGNDEDDGQGVGGHEEHQLRRGTGQELLRGSGADREPHDQAEIVAGDVHQIALVQVLAAAQPGSAHAATVEGEGEAALDQPGPQLERFLGRA